MKKFLPIIIAIALAFGVVLGYLISARSTQNMLGDISNKLQGNNAASNKVTELLNIIAIFQKKTSKLPMNNSKALFRALVCNSTYKKTLYIL